MPQTIEKPTSTIGPGIGSREEETLTHPAFGMIRASRCQGGRGVLFGSDLIHNGHICITISTGQLRRTLSNDWYNSRNEIVEVALSEAQWATFVSSLNMGDGIPCTIESRDGVTQPGLPRPTPRSRQFSTEAAQTLAKAKEHLQAAAKTIKAAKITVKLRDELMSSLEQAAMSIGCNLKFVADQFDEHLERGIQAAKMEVGAYVQQTLIRAGLDHARAPVQLLETSDVAAAVGE